MRKFLLRIKIAWHVLRTGHHRMFNIGGARTTQEGVPLPGQRPELPWVTTCLECGRIWPHRPLDHVERRAVAEALRQVAAGDEWQSIVVEVDA